MTLVTVGNGRQAFFRLLDAVGLIAHALPRPVIVQCGHTPFSSPHLEVRNFVENEEFLRLLDAAVLVISHAGAGTIIQAVRAGHVPVVMPRLARFGEVLDDHQLELAEALGRAGKVFPVLAAADLEPATRKVIAFPRNFANSTTPPLLSIVAGCLAEASQKSSHR